MWHGENTIRDIIKYLLLANFLMCFKKGRYKLWGFYLLSDGCRDTRLEKWEMVQLLYRLNTGWGRTEKEATCLPSTVYVCCPGATDTSVNEEGSQAE